jgi:hypothetical protein
MLNNSVASEISITSADLIMICQYEKTADNKLMLLIDIFSTLSE